MTDIFTKLLHELKERRAVVLVTVIASAGSTPRGTGAQMLVGEEGPLAGTIGGGAVELQSQQLARRLLREGRSVRHGFLLRQNDAEDIGMICGGDVSVWLQFVDSMDADWIELAETLLSRISDGTGGWFVQKLDGSGAALLAGDRERLAGACLTLSEGVPTGVCTLTEDCFIMPLPVRERAVLFGGGHCARALAPLLRQVGFRVTVIDNRPEAAVSEAFPDAEQVICGDYGNVSGCVALTPDDYVVVMTHGHSHDFEVQNQILRMPLAYVGVIGSRGKKAAVNRRLRECGIPESAIEQVHTPIGTAIKAVTPAEIAVSIAGEMIYERAVRRERDGVKKGL